MKPKIIKTKAEYEAATAEIERLWGAEANTSDGDMLELLMLIVEDYETRNSVAIDADPVSLLKAHMEATGRTQSDLAELIGSASRASEILNRKRSLTKEHIFKINTKWKMPANLLIAPYELEVA
ncbi:transcriptional regulator [Stappia taiwanensis]|uniref:Transcriptional regulator n=1 Tax=Stappia taiwanensis TaxID=992267 RepID=A0A838XRZ0_9HYPH|nr:transcriptional regulator [Stappia taiwanensis]MBA4613205.1 transcriptional regulator [Stappia taiwanensis]GGE79511.1 hypothetical protein GCM10007285_04170 [Stappia taiwanensis]